MADPLRWSNISIYETTQFPIENSVFLSSLKIINGCWILPFMNRIISNVSWKFFRPLIKCSCGLVLVLISIIICIKKSVLLAEFSRKFLKIRYTWELLAEPGPYWDILRQCVLPGLDNKELTLKAVCFGKKSLFLKHFWLKMYSITIERWLKVKLFKRKSKYSWKKKFFRRPRCG